MITSYSDYKIKKKQNKKSDISENYSFRFKEKYDSWVISAKKKIQNQSCLMNEK